MVDLNETTDRWQHRYKRVVVFLYADWSIPEILVSHWLEITWSLALDGRWRIFTWVDHIRLSFATDLKLN